jgi:dynein heavy chain
MHDRLPVIKFIPTLQSASPAAAAAATSYSCPLYKAGSRVGVLSTTGVSTNFVLNLDLPLPATGAGARPDHWVRRGVAALCALDD